MKTRLIICGLFCLLTPTSLKATENKVGIDLYESGMIGAAKAFFLDNLKQQREGILQAETCYYLGECYWVSGFRDSAEMYYRKGIEFMPDYSYNRIGLVGLKLGKDADGEELFKEAFTNKKDKKDAGVQLAIARAYLHAGNTVKSMVHVNQARELYCEDGLPYLVEGDILSAQGKVGDACAKYEMAAYFSQDCVGACLKQARLYMSTNRSLAREKLDKAREVCPEFCGIYCMLG